MSVYVSKISTHSCVVYGNDIMNYEWYFRKCLGHYFRGGHRELQPVIIDSKSIRGWVFKMEKYEQICDMIQQIKNGSVIRHNLILQRQLAIIDSKNVNTSTNTTEEDDESSDSDVHSILRLSGAKRTSAGEILNSKIIQSKQLRDDELAIVDTEIASLNNKKTQIIEKYNEIWSNWESDVRKIEQEAIAKKAKIDEEIHEQITEMLKNK
jgi:hypothetical protein